MLDKTEPPCPFLGTKRAAAYMGVSHQWLEVRRVTGPSRKKHKGDGPPFVRVGTRVMYRRADLDKFMEDRLTV